MNLSCEIFGHKYKENSLQGKRTFYSHSCTRVNCSIQSDNPKEELYKKTFWTSDTWDVIKLMATILFWVFFGIFVLILSVVWANSNSCIAYGNMGIEVQYNFWTGCMAKSPEFGWLPIDEFFRTINVNMP